MYNHTPGPWRRCGLHVASGSERVVASCYKDSSDSTATLDVVVRPSSIDECTANARLIAAAPDLLWACGQADTALAALNIGSDEPMNPKVCKRLCKAWTAVREAITKAAGQEYE